MIQALCHQCRGQVGKQVVDQLSVEHVRDLAAFQLKELVDLFGAATGAVPEPAFIDACTSVACQ